MNATTKKKTHLTLKKAREVLGGLHGQIEGYTFNAFTAGNPRQIITVRLWPSKGNGKESLPEACKIARAISEKLAFPVIAESGRILFRVTGGKLEREPRRKLARKLP